MNCTPFVRQYDILFNKWGVCYAKRSTKQTIYAGVQENGCRNHEKSTEMEDYPGKTRAYIDDDLVLHIYTPNVFAPVVEKVSSAKKANAQSSEAKYLTISEYAEVVKKSPPRIRVLCSEGRFPGAVRKGKVWLIPEGTPFPDDKRFVEYPKRPRKQKSEGSENRK